MARTSSPAASISPTSEAPVIAGRYRKLGELGGGGMAVVYEVLDAANGRRVALKRPRLDGGAEHQKRTAELFAREFHTLIQLAHPRIVEVYDYGVDEHGPYYTMEPLDGGDLQSLTPVDYRRACAIASDVCSALSLLHSRRIVHRDVSPRNIRCTGDGLAKLIDFGAMTHMGPSKELVGTPVYCAPEVVHMQPLDARTDLYALGASLYYALTQRHAYAVRDFASLPNAWRFGVARPSELVPGIPDALDALVLDLLQLRPEDRPSNAAEVMARLSAIAGIPLGEHLLVAQAYLSTPVFLGRGIELKRVEAKMERALRRRGSALLIEGPAGVGRSRFLDATLLNAKLLGMTVVRADANDGERDYGVVRRLLCQLQQVLPQATFEVSGPVLPVLGHIVPELAAGRDLNLVPAADVATLRPQLQRALQQLLLGIAERSPLLLAIDDLHAIDEPSTATLGLLAQQVQHARLVISATAVTGATPNAAAGFKLFADKASKVGLANLTEDETQSLLASVFGASPALEALTHRLHVLSSGSPRDLMRLAQHLVDSGAARYEAGAWTWPFGAGAAALPSSVAQVLLVRLRLLAAAARDLAIVLALCPEKSFSFEECAQLSDRTEPRDLLGDIEQLTQLDVLRALGDRVALSDRAWVPLLHQELDPARERALHLRLSRVFEARPDERFRHAQHLLRAGETARALDEFVAHALASRAATDRNFEAFHQLLLSLPSDWFETYEQVLALLADTGRPKSDAFAISLRLAGLAAVAGVGHAEVLKLVMQLKQASGLSDWEWLDPALDAGLRLKMALGQAQARYVASPELERVADPGTAIRELANTVRLAISISALTMDLESALAVPSLQPLIALSPALAIPEQLTRGVQARLSGRVERTREIYRALIERLSAAEGTGLELTHREYARLMVMNGLAVIDAASGLAGCLDAADQIERNPTLQSNAWLIRMVYQLWQGNSQEAERCRKKFDVARVQSSAAQSFESVQLTWQLAAHVAMEDLTRIKHSLAEVAPMAARFPAFRIVQGYGDAEYQRIRGDSAGALASLAKVLPLCAAGTHQLWPQLAAAHVRALDDAGELERAAQQAQTYLADAARAELGPSASYWIALAACLVEAKLGRPHAAATAEGLIEHCVTSGATGLKLGLAYEARACVAVLQSDAESCERYRSLCAREFARGANPALSAKLQRLKRMAQARQLASQAPMLPGGEQTVLAVVKSKLRMSSDATARARDLLSLLAQHSGAGAGHLYQIRNGAPTWVASVGTGEPDGALLGFVREYVLAEVHAGAQTTGADDVPTVKTEWSAFAEGSSYRPVLLSHYVDAGHTISGVAVLIASPDAAFAYPGEMAAQISRVMQEAGDVTGLLVADD